MSIVTRGLNDIAIVDIRMGEHCGDNILQSLIVRLHLVLTEHVLNRITFLILGGSSESVKKDDVHCDLRVVINEFKALLNSRHGIEAHCSASIDEHASVDWLRDEKRRKTGR